MPEVHLTPRELVAVRALVALQYDADTQAATAQVRAEGSRRTLDATLHGLIEAAGHKVPETSAHLKISSDGRVLPLIAWED